MKQEMMGWQWHQLGYMEIICTLLQSDNHTGILSLNFEWWDVIVGVVVWDEVVLTFLVLPFWYLLTRVIPDKFQKSSKMGVCVYVFLNALSATQPTMSKHCRQFSTFGQ